MKKLTLCLIVLSLLAGIVQTQFDNSLIIIQSKSEIVHFWVKNQYYDSQTGYVILIENYPNEIEIDGSDSRIEIRL